MNSQKSCLKELRDINTRLMKMRGYFKTCYKTNGLDMASIVCFDIAISCIDKGINLFKEKEENKNFKINMEIKKMNDHEARTRWNDDIRENHGPAYDLRFHPQQILHAYIVGLERYSQRDKTRLPEDETVLLKLRRMQECENLDRGLLNKVLLDVDSYCLKRVQK